jgi:hypothetical protein
MAGLVHNGATFPLQDRLNLALPVSAYRIGNAQAFSGPDAGIDTGKMAYFALSIIWRSAVHKWHISSRATTTLSLGAHEEQIRKYLLGEASFPPDVAVMATVCTDLPSREGFYVPGAVRNSAVPAYAVMVKGIYFRAFMASNLPPDIRRNCCVTSPRCPIFLRNCEREALETWGNLCATSRPVGALAGTN